MSVADEDIALAGEYALGLLDAESARAFEARLAAEPELREVYRDFAEDFAAMAADPVAPPAALERRVMAALAPQAPKRGRFGGWVLGAGFGAALAAALGAAVFFGAFQLPEPNRLEAELVGDGVSLAAVWTEAQGGEVVFVRDGGAPPAGRVHELWAIIGNDPPRSLGLVPDGDREVNVALAIPRDVPVLLAISVEPFGGSPTGAPTGEVVASAPLTPL